MKADLNKLKKKIVTIPLMKILEVRTAQDTWETLKNEIIKAQTETISQRKKNKRYLTRPAWLHK